jgi:hypothetical protein
MGSPDKARDGIKNGYFPEVLGSFSFLRKRFFDVISSAIYDEGAERAVRRPAAPTAEIGAGGRETG